MFASRKRVFAGKHNLESEPLCPYLTNNSGYMSLHTEPAPWVELLPHREERRPVRSAGSYYGLKRTPRHL